MSILGVFSRPEGVLIAFAAVTACHYLSLFLQSRFHFYTKRFGRAGFYIHFAITFFLWAWLTMLFEAAGPMEARVLPQWSGILYIAGTLVMYGGFFLAVWSFWYLGVWRMWGIRYFENVHEAKTERCGPYRFFKNPMYTGFVIFFFGEAIANRSPFYFLISIESYLLLNVWLAHFENRGLSKSF